MKEKINPNKHYNLKEIVDQELMGKGKSYFICKNYILKDATKPKKDRELNATIAGEGRGTSYTVKGANLIKYLEM
jgi:hypothetical protein